MKTLITILVTCVILVSCENNYFLSVNVSDSWSNVKLSQPFRAINSGAAIFVDVTSVVGTETDMRVIQKMFPPGVIIAVLKSSDGVEFSFANEDSFIRQSGRIEIKLSAKNEIKAGLKFVELKIRSNGIKLNKTSVRWISSGL